MSMFPASKAVGLVSALTVAALMSLSGCGGPGSTATVESQQSELRLQRKDGEECCRLQFRPGRNRERCLDDCAHGRFNHGCEIRHDAGVHDAGNHDAGNHDAGVHDGSSDGPRNIVDGASGKPDAAGTCPTIASVVPPSEDLPNFTDVLITVTPADANPDDVLTFSWTATGGTLTPPGLTANTPAQFFECTSVGPQTITIAVSNGVCGSSASITINCVAVCGDNFIEPGEDCDPPNSVPNGRILCDATCHFLGTCGNGTIDPGEQCDPPSPGLCGTDCQRTAICGDGIIGPGEQCDPPHQGPDGIQCGSNCQFLTCGNFQIDPGEQCDPPRSQAVPGLPACTQDCQIPTCGNLVLDPGEGCDPPDGTTCNSSCQPIPVVCGDGIVEPGETCDFPNVEFCNQCQTTTCGGCFFAATGNDPACQSLTGTARTTCQALLSCLSTGLAQCVAGLFGGSGPTCYCSDATCSAGANGECAAQFNAVAGTSDPTVVLGQLNDRTSFLNQVRNEAVKFGGFGCGMFCR